MDKLWKVLSYEFRTFVSNRTFIILTILGPFIIAAMSILPSLFAMQNKVVEIGILGSRQEGIELRASLEMVGIDVVRISDSRAALDSQVKAGELYGYLVFPDNLLDAETLTFVTKGIADITFLERLKVVVGQGVVRKRLVAAGYQPSDITRLIALPLIETQQLTQKGTRVQQDFLSALLTGIAFTMLLYMTILLYGQAIGRSVLREKSSKTVEIMLSSVGENDLLFGKIFGQTAAGLLQYGIWITVALIIIKVLGPRLNLNKLPQLEAGMIFFLLLFFLLGFLLYAALFAALGAAAQDEGHFGQLSWPIIMILVIPMVSVSVSITSPHSAFSVILSIFPMTAPMVMFVRMVVTDPEPWQIFLSISLLILAVVVLMLLSAKIFRIGILMTGKRFKVREILRWIRA